MLEGGLGAATISAIAARAGVSKATVYKWWSSPGEVALDGLLEQFRASIEPPAGAGIAQALEFQLGALVKLVRDTPCGAILRAVACEADSDAELARSLRERWLGPRRAVTFELVRRAMARGEIRDDVDPHLILDMMFSPVYYRLMFSRDPLPDDLAAQTVALAMRALARG